MCSILSKHCGNVILRISALILLSFQIHTKILNESQKFLSGEYYDLNTKEANGMYWVFLCSQMRNDVHTSTSTNDKGNYC